MNFFTFLYVLMILLTACSSNRSSKTSIDTGVSGHLQQIFGNQMPSPDQPPSQPAVMLGTIYIYEPTLITQTIQKGSEPLFYEIKTRFIDSVKTDDKGFFQTSLPAGTYSIFVKQGNLFFANQFDQNNYIHPFTVTKGKITQVKVLVNNEATY